MKGELAEGNRKKEKEKAEGEDEESGVPSGGVGFVWKRELARFGALDSEESKAALSASGQIG
jgi:hypothetical protein